MGEPALERVPEAEVCVDIDALADIEGDKIAVCVPPIDTIDVADGDSVLDAIIETVEWNDIDALPEKTDADDVSEGRREKSGDSVVQEDRDVDAMLVAEKTGDGVSLSDALSKMEYEELMDLVSVAKAEAVTESHIDAVTGAETDRESELDPEMVWLTAGLIDPIGVTEAPCE